MTHSMIAIALVALHCALRFGVAVSARCAVGGKGSKSSLALSLLWTLAPIVAGLVLAHLIQKFVILPNYSGHGLNWFGRLIPGPIPFNYALAAMCCIVALPVAIAALFSGPLLRSAARRLEGLVTD